MCDDDDEDEEEKDDDDDKEEEDGVDKDLCEVGVIALGDEMMKGWLRWYNRGRRRGRSDCD